MASKNDNRTTVGEALEQLKDFVRDNAPETTRKNWRFDEITGFEVSDLEIVHQARSYRNTGIGQLNEAARMYETTILGAMHSLVLYGAKHGPDVYVNKFPAHLWEQPNLRTLDQTSHWAASLDVQTMMWNRQAED